MRILAQPQLISTLRAAVSDLAARADFDLDTISDLRMAVDEACTSLIRLTSDQNFLTCTFTVSKDKMEVAVRTEAVPPNREVNTRGFGWRVLQALTDETHAESNLNGNSRQIGIHFIKYVAAP